MGSIADDNTMNRPLSQLRKNAIAAVEAYNTWDIEQIMSFRTSDSIHEILPSTCPAPFPPHRKHPLTSRVETLERPMMDFTTYQKYFGAIMPWFHDFHVTITDTIEDALENKVALWAKSTGSTDIGDYSNEYMLVFYFDEGQEKIVRSLEFVDSGTTKPYMIELGKYIREKKGQDGFENRYGS